MRLLLSIGILVLHAATFIATANQGGAVFCFNKQEQHPRIDAVTYMRIIENSIKATTESINAFSHKLFKEITKDAPENFLWSPASASLILSMLSFGAAGGTRKEIRDALSFPTDEDEAKRGFHILADNLAEEKYMPLIAANKIFYSNRITASSEFIGIATDLFRSKPSRIDLAIPEKASCIMNEWCAKATNYHIRTIIRSDDIGADALVILLSALYFKGTWMKRFDHTEEVPFEVRSGLTKQVTGMVVSGEFRYGLLPEVHSRFIELPYKTKSNMHKVSMFIILPNSRDGLDHLEKNFDRVTVDKLIHRGRPTGVMIVLPKFRIQSKITLNEPLARMGMTSAFEQVHCVGSRSDFNLGITKFVQKTFLEVDEFGREPAIDPREQPPQIGVMFAALHPFIAVVATTGEFPVPLVVARYGEP